MKEIRKTIARWLLKGIDETPIQRYSFGISTEPGSVNYCDPVAGASWYNDENGAWVKWDEVKNARR